MFYKTTKVERSFTISIGDLIFQVKNNLLLVCDENGNLLKTPIYLEELQTLLEFFEKAMSIFRPGSYAEGEVDINTVDNCAAYEYRVEELKMEGT